MKATHLTFGQYAPGSKYPGAWRVEEAPGARWVADCPTEEQARLFAAAPELLATLVNLVQYAEQGAAVHPGAEVWNLARHAIAKATGEEVPS